VLPAADGGPYYHRGNLVILCPLHHHLFDHHRLAESEWEVLQQHIESKMASARLRAIYLRHELLQRCMGRTTTNEVDIQEIRH
jgi:hypothetical protein